jgi:hypothetical protein
MANTAPATVTITGSTGPGQAVTTQKFTDVVDIEYDFVRNVVKVTRAGASGIIYYDYSALTTITQVIASGLTTIVML